MVTIFRFEQKRYAKDAYSGYGAKLKSARWHKRGHEAIYTSGSRALCAMEMLVQFDPEDMPDYVCIPAKVPKDVFDGRKILDAKDLPDKWRSYPPPPTLQHLGTRWLEAGDTFVLEVPSAIINEERNYILNPRHADIKKMVIGDAEPFTFDPRLFGKR